jgi:hypothetical protein
MKITYDLCREESIEYLGRDTGNKVTISNDTIFRRNDLESYLIEGMKDIVVVSGLEDREYYDRELYYFYTELATQQHLMG